MPTLAYHHQLHHPNPFGGRDPGSHGGGAHGMPGQGMGGFMPPRPTSDAFRAGRDSVLGDRYRVVDEAGKGNFARVMRAFDSHTQDSVAVKVLSREYARDAQFEHAVLKAISKKDPNNMYKVSKMRDHFVQDGCPCFVFPLLGPTLKTRRLGKHNCSREEIGALGWQLCKALAFLHFECRLVHTDLKPENILLDKPDASPRGLGTSWTIVDFGSASFFAERPDSDLISTRPYRAPEVVVGGGWSYAADMWSVACILYEVYSGRLLFDAANDAQHLQLMQRTLGLLPPFVCENASPQQQRMFDSSGRLRPSIGMGPPTHLSDTIGEDPELLDLLTRLLEYDPAMRLRADEVCAHPFCAPHAQTSRKRRNSSGGRDSRGSEGSERGAGSEVLQHSQLPPSAYTSGAVRTPGTRHLAAGGGRPPADRVLNEGEAQGLHRVEPPQDFHADRGQHRGAPPHPADPLGGPPASMRQGLMRPPMEHERRHSMELERRHSGDAARAALLADPRLADPRLADPRVVDPYHAAHGHASRFGPPAAPGSAYAGRLTPADPREAFWAGAQVRPADQSYGQAGYGVRPHASGAPPAYYGRPALDRPGDVAHGYGRLAPERRLSGSLY
eukprot:TRINITY_DN3344_c0_g1_i1.p1 TRINITY_DN3344_c0_g1~~TRINITY_DN3344_c0_g1_i1.p1  ORF type:complete len:642 (+),score=176.09 TRINITY_DN3344_c0_g1_i1:85-1926(+)